jgi:glycosyltransferase involved in cell wall biosynthesis
VIAGGSSYTDGYVDRLRTSAAADPRVVMPGYVYGPALDALYANAAVFVLPSRLEGLPLTLLEAAAHGRPVVVSDIAPHREVVGGHGPGRRLFAVGDVEHLADQLAFVLGAGGGSEERGAVALRREVLAHYDWDAVTEATEVVYQRLADGAPASDLVDVYPGVTARRARRPLVELDAAVGASTSPPRVLVARA